MYSNGRLSPWDAPDCDLTRGQIIGRWLYSAGMFLLGLPAVGSLGFVILTMEYPGWDRHPAAGWAWLAWGAFVAVSLPIGGWLVERDRR